MKSIRFKEWICTLTIGVYYNGNIAIQLEEAGTKEPICVATANFEEPLPYGYAHIKDYAENKGMLDALNSAGCIRRIIAYRESGYVAVPLVELNMKELLK